MLCDSTLIQQLLNPSSGASKIQKILQQQDQKYITFKKTQLLNKLPKQLRLDGSQSQKNRNQNGEMILHTATNSILTGLLVDKTIKDKDSSISPLKQFPSMFDHILQEQINFHQSAQSQSSHMQRYFNYSIKGKFDFSEDDKKMQSLRQKDYKQGQRRKSFQAKQGKKSFSPFQDKIIQKQMQNAQTMMGAMSFSPPPVLNKQSQQQQQPKQPKQPKQPLQTQNNKLPQPQERIPSPVASSSSSKRHSLKDQNQNFNNIQQQQQSSKHQSGNNSIHNDNNNDIQDKLPEKYRKLVQDTVSPFVSTNMNFTDKHANKKAIGGSSNREIQMGFGLTMHAYNMLNYSYNQKGFGGGGSGSNVIGHASLPSSFNKTENNSYHNYNYNNNNHHNLKVVDQLKDVMFPSKQRSNPFRKTERLQGLYNTQQSQFGATNITQSKVVNNKNNNNSYVKNNSFNTVDDQFSSNIQNVMRYTLNIPPKQFGGRNYQQQNLQKQQQQQQKSSSTKHKMMDNPFVRLPSSKKYQQQQQHQQH